MTEYLGRRVLKKDGKDKAPTPIRIQKLGLTLYVKSSHFKCLPSSTWEEENKKRTLKGENSVG